MSTTQHTQVGSGTLPFTRSILPEAQRGVEVGSEGIRHGAQVIMANPEDLVAVDAFAASGIVVGTSEVEIISPNTNPLPRCREIIIENVGAADVYLSHLPGFVTDLGFELATEGTAGRDSRIRLPLLHNVTVYGKTASGSSSIRLIIV
jgi:hypothetical protein